MNEKAPEGKAFKLNGKKVIRTITELAIALDKATDSDYKYHVSLTRNDFAAWVEEVHGQKELAKKIKDSKNRHEAVRALKASVNQHYAQQKVQKIKYDDMLKLPDGFPGGDHHHEFIHPQFVYGMIFGVVLTLIVIAVYGAL